MKLGTLRRNTTAMSRLAAALMLCALPALAQDEDSEAAPAQQGSHYEARPDDGQSETEEAPAPIQQQPAARTRAVPRVFRARPGGVAAEPNQEAASPGVVDGVLQGGGVSQGAADKQVGQGSGSSSGVGGFGGTFSRQLACTPRAAVTSAQSVCSWNYTGTVGPPSPMPSSACTQSNAGTIIVSDAARSYTCICSQQTVVSQPAIVCPTTPTTPIAQGSAPAGCQILPVTWSPGLDLHQNSERKTPRQTNNAGEMQAFEFAPFSNPGGHVGISYSHCNTDVSISLDPCDFRPRTFCTWPNIMDPTLVIQTSDHPLIPGRCVLPAGKPFYFNVSQPAGAATNGCNYYLSW